MSVTAPRGFRAAGVAAGLKPSGAPDVALVVNDGPRVRRRRRLHRQPVQGPPGAVEPGGRQGRRRSRAVVLNSGGANGYTGPEGFQDTHAIAEQVAAGCSASAPSTSWSARPA